MTPDKPLLDPYNYQLLMITLGVISSILWAMLQYNFNRFVKRQDSFSSVKDDHEKRLTSLESSFRGFLEASTRRDYEVNRSFDRFEKNIDEVRLDVKTLSQHITHYLLQVKDANHKNP